jgi:hypothetical protein
MLKLKRRFSEILSSRSEIYLGQPKDPQWSRSRRLLSRVSTSGQNYRGLERFTHPIIVRIQFSRTYNGVYFWAADFRTRVSRTYFSHLLWNLALFLPIQIFAIYRVNRYFENVNVRNSILISMDRKWFISSFCWAVFLECSGGPLFITPSQTKKICSKWVIYSIHEGGG